MKAERCACGGHDQGCGCSVGRLRGFLEACLVLLVAERPAHGYDLLPRLGRFGLATGAVDAGTAYRTLRRLEEEGIVRSRWCTEAAGPARRVYEVTPEGLDLLRAWRTGLAAVRDDLDRYMAACDAVVPGEEK